MSERNVFHEINVYRVPLESKVTDTLSVEAANAYLWNPVRNPIAGSVLMVRFEDYQSLLNAHAEMVAVADIRSEEIDRLRKRIHELGG